MVKLKEFQKESQDKVSLMLQEFGEVKVRLSDFEKQLVQERLDKEVMLEELIYVNIKLLQFEEISGEFKMVVIDLEKKIQEMERELGDRDQKIYQF